MPLTEKGKKILASMKAEYGARKGESVFYASKNRGTIEGVEGKRGKKKRSFLTGRGW
jgi:hypothetical protein